MKLNKKDSPPSTSEAELVTACQQGDHAALKQVFNEHSLYLERLLTRIAGPQEDIEDLIQMTFIAAIRAFPRFRGEARIKTWLTRIAIRIAQEQFRKPERRRRVKLEIIEYRDPNCEGSDLDAKVDAKRQVERLYQHLEAIAPKKRIAFILHVVDGHPIDEVAALTGASRPATKSRVFWARRELLARIRKDSTLNRIIHGEQLK